jgi:hypothetical protein
MDASLNAKKLALKVLMAITEGRAPDDADVEDLRRLAPLFSDLSLDDLACEVVMLELTRRKQLQQAAGSKGSAVASEVSGEE